MTYKVGDLVYFDGDGKKGVGEIASQHMDFINHYLVRSSQIKHQHNGVVLHNNNWWFSEDDLKPFVKKVGQKYKVIGDRIGRVKLGELVTLTCDWGDSISTYKKENGRKTWLYDLDHSKCELEFYADVEDVPSAKEENKMFTKEDLTAGYLVKVRDGRFAHLVDTIDNGMCLNYENGWDTLRVYNNDLTSQGSDRLDIIEVYGFTIKGYHAHKFEVGDRKLLWKREEVKEMTIEDIQKVLGHKIKVVE